MIQRFSAETRFFDYSNLADEIKKILEDFTDKKYKISSDHYGNYIAITFTDNNSKGFKNTVLDLTIPVGSGSEDDSPELTGTLNDFTFDAEEIDGIQWKGIANDRTVFEVDSKKLKLSLVDAIRLKIPKQNNSSKNTQAVSTRLIQEIDNAYDNFTKDGYTVEINDRLPTITIDNPRKGTHILFVQGEEAEDVLNAVPNGVDQDAYVVWYLNDAFAEALGHKHVKDWDRTSSEIITLKNLTGEGEREAIEFLESYVAAPWVSCDYSERYAQFLLQISLLDRNSWPKGEMYNTPWASFSIEDVQGDILVRLLQMSAKFEGLYFKDVRVNSLQAAVKVINKYLRKGSELLKKTSSKQGTNMNKIATSQNYSQYGLAKLVVKILKDQDKEAKWKFDDSDRTAIYFKNAEGASIEIDYNTGFSQWDSNGKILKSGEELSGIEYDAENDLYEINADIFSKDLIKHLVSGTSSKSSAGAGISLKRLANEILEVLKSCEDSSRAEGWRIKSVSNDDIEFEDSKDNTATFEISPVFGGEFKLEIDGNKKSNEGTLDGVEFYEDSDDTFSIQDQHAFQESIEGIEKAVKYPHILPDHMVREYKRGADSWRKKGFTIEINTRHSYVSVDAPDGENIYFAQDHEADDLLEEVPDNVNEADYILYMLDNAGILSDNEGRSSKTAADEEGEDQTYTFDELDDKGKENVINWLAETMDYFDPDVEYFKEESDASKKFENIDKIWYAVGGGQGDYANFEFDGLTEEYLKKMLNEQVGNKAEAEFMQECAGFNVSTTDIGRSGRVINLDLEWVNTPDESDIKGKYFELYEDDLRELVEEEYEDLDPDNVKEAIPHLNNRDFDNVTENIISRLIDIHQRGIEDFIQEDYEQECGELQSNLRKDYEYQTSEEFARETCEANDYVFTEDGKLVR